MIHHCSYSRRLTLEAMSTSDDSLWRGGRTPLADSHGFDMAIPHCARSCTSEAYSRLPPITNPSFAFAEASGSIADSL